MKKLLVSALLIALFMNGCSTATPISKPDPAPTVTAQPLPTSTTEPAGAMVPELVFEIRNGSDPLHTPYGIALDSSGRIYVNDAGNSRVLVFDEAGTLLTKWDQQGSSEGEFKSLGFGGIATDGNVQAFILP